MVKVLRFPVLNGRVAPRSPQPFILWVPGSPGNRVVKSKLSPRSVCVALPIEIHPQNGAVKFFLSKSFKLTWQTDSVMSSYKKISMTQEQGSIGVCYRLLCSNLSDWILCTLSPNHNIHRINGVYQRWTTCALKSKSLVSEMHFPGIWRSTFTDFASKKTQSSGKNRCRQKSLDKSLNTVQKNVPF